MMDPDLGYRRAHRHGCSTGRWGWSRESASGRDCCHLVRDGGGKDSGQVYVSGVETESGDYPEQPRSGEDHHRLRDPRVYRDRGSVRTGERQRKLAASPYANSRAVVSREFLDERGCLRVTVPRSEEHTSEL